MAKKKESDFQGTLIKDIKKRFPGCMVLKNDPNYIQGVPDLSIFYKNKWAVLECKRSENEPFRPNQKYYIKKMNSMSYANVIYPENKEDILNEIQQSFES